MRPTPGAIQPVQPNALGFFNFEVFTGTRWMSLNDQLNYRVGAESFEQVQHPRKRHTVESSMYDGEWEVHSTAGNVTEVVTVNILGSSHNHVTENLLALTEAFTEQDLYSCRKTMGNHLETWRCFPAEYVLNRGHIQAHAVRAQIKLSIPRFPKATYEVVP